MLRLGGLSDLDAHALPLALGLLIGLARPMFAFFGHTNPGTKMGQQRSAERAVIGMVFHEQDVHAAKGHKAG